MALRPFSASDLWRLKSVSDVRCASDGGITFTVTAHDQEEDASSTAVWTVPSTGGDPAPVGASPAHSGRPSPDGTHVAFVADRGEQPQLHVVAAATGGAERRLTEMEHGVSQPCWSPDGRYIAFAARTGAATDPDGPRVVRHLRQRLDGFGWLDDRRSHLFKVEVESGVVTQLTTGDHDDEAPSWSPDGRTIVFVSDRSADRFDRPFHRDVWAIDATGESPGKARRLTRGRGDAMEAHVSPDGRSVAFVGGEHGDAMWSAATELLVVPLDGSDHEPRSLTSHHDVQAGTRFLASGRQLAWLDDRTLVFCGPHRGGLALFQIDSEGKALDLRSDLDQSINGFDVLHDGGLAYPSIWIDRPSEVCVARNGTATPVTALNDEVRVTVALAAGERIRSQSSDGTEIESFLVRPPAGVESRGLVVDIHGGPHGMNPGTSAGGWLAVQALAGAGYSVVLPNPRGSAGYGRDFLRACVGDWGGGDAEDILGAVGAAEKLTGASPTYVWGYSFGGYMSAWLLGHSDRFAAAVIGAPVIDLVSMMGTTDIPSFTLHEAGGLPWERLDSYAKHSPLTYASNIEAPVLLLHHEGDLRCPIGQSEQLFTTLRLLGKEVELVRYPGGFHGVARPSFVVDRTQRLVRWFQDRP